MNSKLIMSTFRLSLVYENHKYNSFLESYHSSIPLYIFSRDVNEYSSSLLSLGHNDNELKLP